MKFEIGHYYRTHNGLADTRAEERTVDGYMEPLCNGVPRKCVSVDEPNFESRRLGYDAYVKFKGIEYGSWNYCSSDFEEVPLLRVIDTADWLAPETKTYARQAVIDCILGKNGKVCTPSAPGFNTFVSWDSTKEGYAWWVSLHDKCDPGVPGAAADKPVDTSDGIDVQDAPSGSHVVLVSVLRGDGYEHRFEAEFKGKVGKIIIDGSGDKRILYQDGHEQGRYFMRGARCRIVNPAEPAPPSSPELHEISTILVGTRVRLVSYAEGDPYGRESSNKYKYIGKIGMVQSSRAPSSAGMSIVFEEDGKDIDRVDAGAMCEILSPAPSAGRRTPSGLVRIEDVPVGARIKIVKIAEADMTIARRKLGEEGIILKPYEGTSYARVQYNDFIANPDHGTLVEIVSHPVAIAIENIYAGTMAAINACTGEVRKAPRPKPRVHVEPETFSYTPKKSASWAKVLRSLKTQ
jgi:hypothetical protein